MSEQPRPGPMAEKRFWDIVSVGCSPGSDADDWYQGLVEVLTKLDPEEIVAFDLLFDEKTDALYTVDHWGAAYLINGGASDDGFYYFRCWLVGMGKQVYEAALADPDSLADVVDPAEEYEAEIYGAAPSAWRELGLDDGAYTAAYTAQRKRGRLKLKGRRWDFESNQQVRRRLPRLAALYLTEDDE